jgi:hypothetical protein
MDDGGGPSGTGFFTGGESLVDIGGGLGAAMVGGAPKFGGAASGT